MNDKVKKRIALSLGIKPEEVPEDFEELKKAIEKRSAELKAVKHG